MSYATEHAGALADIADAGGAVTFTGKTQAYNASTDTTTTSTQTVVGSAVRVQGDPKQYETLKLVQLDPITLLFAPSTYGQVPLPNMTVTWNSTVYTVRSVDTLAPDGTAILSRVVMSR